MQLVIVSHGTYVTAKSLNRIVIFVAWFKKFEPREAKLTGDIFLPIQQKCGHSGSLCQNENRSPENFPMTIKAGISHRPKKNSPIEMWFHHFSAGFSDTLSDGEKNGFGIKKTR